MCIRDSVVMADNAGGVTGNYHGTTVLAQTLRVLWPDFYTACLLYTSSRIPYMGP